MAWGMVPSPLVLLWCLTLAYAAPWQATIVVTDSASPVYHAHPPGSSFTIQVKATYQFSGSDRIYYQWQDADSNALNPRVQLTSGVQVSIQSPHSWVGYYQLVFSAGNSIKLPGRNVGETYSVGFVIQNFRGYSISPSSYFGTVHTDIDDPFMPSWTKTMWWPDTLGPDWGSSITYAQSSGKLELGLITGVSDSNGVSWETLPDDNSIVSTLQLNQLKSEAQLYFAGYTTSANAVANYVELGLEENIQGMWYQTHYASNLAAKAQAMREGANAAGATNLKFIFQVVTSGEMDDIIAFLESDAYDEFDILSLHIYPWPNFVNPDQFMSDILTQTKAHMTMLNKVKPIWVTEAGIPTNDPFVTGYHNNNDPVTGSTRTRAAAYMIRFHVLAISLGVEKVFWYNYQDGWFDRQDSEANFGMRTYEGFPVPTYASMITLQNKLDGTTFVSKTLISPTVVKFHFQSATKDVFVLYNPTSVFNSTIPLDLVKPGLTSSAVLEHVDKVGHPLFRNANNVIVGYSPIFIVTAASAPPTEPPTVPPPTEPPTLPPTSPPSLSYLIFDDELSVSWDMYPARATAGFEPAPAPQYSGSNALKFEGIDSAGGWGLVEFATPSLSISSKTHLEVSIKGGQSSSAVTVQAYAGPWSTAVPWKSITNYGPAPVTGRWTTYYIPLSDLGLSSNVTNVVIQDNTGTPDLVFYYDKLQIISVTGTWVFENSLLSGWARRQARATVTQVSSPTYSGSAAFKFVGSSSQTYGNLELYTTGPALSISGFTHFVFAAQSGQSSSNIVVQVFYAPWSSSTPYASANSYNPQPSQNGYTVYAIPLVDFNVFHEVRYIMFTDETGATGRTYYFDQIGFATIV